MYLSDCYLSQTINNRVSGMLYQQAFSHEAATRFSTRLLTHLTSNFTDSPHG